MLPVIRTFISFPAGMSRMPLGEFSLFTFLGALPWSLALAYIGMKLGENWDTLGGYFHKADIAIGIVLIAGITWYVWRHVRNIKKDARDAGCERTQSPEEDL
jgi:membrane protein DedA with SNARE-associated domain